METGYNTPDTFGEGDALNEQTSGEDSQAGDVDEEKPNLAPDTDGDYQVLHKDGSLADLPDQDTDGSGALEGTVGLGT